MGMKDETGQDKGKRGEWVGVEWGGGKGMRGNVHTCGSVDAFFVHSSAIQI